MFQLGFFLVGFFDCFRDVCVVAGLERAVRHRGESCVLCVCVLCVCVLGEMWGSGEIRCGFYKLQRGFASYNVAFYHFKFQILGIGGILVFRFGLFSNFLGFQVGPVCFLVRYILPLKIFCFCECRTLYIKITNTVVCLPVLFGLPTFLEYPFNVTIKTIFSYHTFQIFILFFK